MMWIVVCTDWVAGMPDVVTYVGPFYDREPAEAYCSRHMPNFDLLHVHPLAQPPKMDQIHPDQAQIGDYIDPSVVT